jgi:hypothetical protein
MCDSLFELNVTNREKIEKYIQMHKWDTFLKEETLEIFKEVETEVKIFLVRQSSKYLNKDTISVFHSS